MSVLCVARALCICLLQRVMLQFYIYLFIPLLMRTLSTRDMSFALVFLATTSWMEQTLNNEFMYEEVDG